MTDFPDSAGTVFDALLEAVRQATDYNRNDQVAPAAILWTDKDREWEPLTPRLRTDLPHFLTLGDYDPEARTGPAIWLRCMIARTLPGADWPENTVPIVYLPGVSRQELRSVDECPKALQRIAELQYRGVFFTQYNARDWTILAFLQSDRSGLGLDVSHDNETVEAMKRAIVRLAEIPVEQLRGKHLEVSDFNRLLTPDPARDILTWLNEPEGIKAVWDEARWRTFCSVCQERYGFDPEADGELVGAEKLGKREGEWDGVWRRFAEAPGRYPNLPDLLRRARPSGLLLDASSWPQENERREGELRAALEDLADTPVPDVAERIRELDKEHGGRRSWVWAELGEAPLAMALEPLCRLAEAVTSTPGGATLEDMAESYFEVGWQADAAVLDALNCVRRDAEAEAVKPIVNALYGPWLEAGARRFQELIVNEEVPKPPADVATPEAGTCVLFADGLRCDVARRVGELLESRGLTADLDWHWAACPTVTPTSKPAISPVGQFVTGGDTGEDFALKTVEGDKALTADRFRRLLEEQGIQALGPGETGDPQGSGWTECGSLDTRGHEEGWKLAWRVSEELQGITDRIVALLEAGWREVHVVTDHGWLLLPGGLPKSPLSGHLAETRWGRCAVLKRGAVTEYLKYAWHWNADVTVVTAPDIRCFFAGKEYDHGGVSLQECVVPRLVVRAPAEMAARARIAHVEWRGLRCRVEVEGEAPGAKVDIRTRVNDPASTLVSPEPLDAEGKASILVVDDSLEDTAVTVVLLDGDAKVIDKQLTTVGGMS